MAARVRRTSRITSLERTEPETGGLAVGPALAMTVTATMAARKTSRRSETSRTAAAVLLWPLVVVVVLWLVVMRPMMVLGFVLVFVLVLFLVMVVIVLLGLVRSFVTAEDAEERTSRPDGPDHRGVDLHCSMYGQHRRFVRGLRHRPGRHELSVLDWLPFFGHWNRYGSCEHRKYDNERKATTGKHFLCYRHVF